MEKDQSRSVGLGSYLRRLQDRVFRQSAAVQLPEVNSSPRGGGEEKGTRGRNCGVATEECYSASDPRRVGGLVPFIILSGSKEGKPLAANHQSEASKQVLHRTATIQDGNLIIDRTLLAEGDVGDVVGHQGCVPPHTHTSVVNEIPRLHVLAAGFRFSLPALRVVYRAEGVYQSLSCGGGASAFEGFCNIRIHRRLADCERIQRSVISRYGSSCVSIAATRLDNQSQEVLSRPFTEDHLLGSSIRLRRRFGFPVVAQDRCSTTASVFLPSRLPLPGQALAPFARHHGKYGGPYRVVQAEDEGDSNTVTAPVQADQFTSFLFRATSEFGPDGLCNTGSSSGHFVVDGSESPPAGETFSGYETSGVFNNGCFSVGLGRDLSVRDDVGSLVITGLSTTHQRSGAVSDKQLDPVLDQTVAGTSGDGIHGQRVGRSVYQPRGRDSLQPHVPDSVSDVAVLSVQRHSSASLLPARKGKRRGGCVIEGSSAKRRVVSKSAVGGPPIPHLRQTSSGSVCQPQKSQASNFLRLEDGGSRLARGCLQSRVGLPTRLRIPSVVTVAEDSIQTRPSNGSPVSASRSLLAEPDLVSTSSAPISGSSVSSTSTRRPPGPGRDSIPQSEQSTSFCLDALNSRRREAGISSDAAGIAANSIRPSTVRTYDARVRKFISWAEGNCCNPVEASLAQVTSFLTSIFRGGLQVSTVRNYRSALSSIHRGFADGSTIGTNVVISQLLTGMFNERPTVRRLRPSWSINEVLEVLSKPPYEPMDKSTLEHLTHKTVFLITAASGRRRSCIHALTTKPHFLRIDTRGARLLPDPSFLAKNQSLSFTPEEIYLPKIGLSSSVREDRLVCPVRALRWYLDRTGHLRTSQQLFIIPRKPYTPAARDTISKWVQRLIQPFAEEGEQVRAHDVRGHAASKAWFRGVSLEDVMKAAAWKTPSTFVASYLVDTVSSEGDFARAVLERPGPSTRPPC